MGHYEKGHPNGAPQQQKRRKPLQKNNHRGTNTIRNVGNPEQKYQKPQLITSKGVDSPQKQEESRTPTPERPRSKSPDQQRQKPFTKKLDPKSPCADNGPRGQVMDPAGPARVG